MRQRTVRRAVAAASATAMAGAALVVGGAGVASAGEGSATHVVAGTGVPTWISQFSITRTLNDVTPTYGDTVTMTTNVQRDTHGYLLYRVRDFTPECMEYVPNSARWQAHGGGVASEATSPGEFSRNAEYIQFNHGGGVTATPFWMTAEYVVTCEAGPISSGGTWIRRALTGSAELGDRDFGPQMNVQRKGTSMFLHVPSSAQVGKAASLSVDTTTIPDGSQVTFTVDGQTIGSDTVDGGTATVQWTPEAAGSRTITASFGQTGTHTASSDTRTVTVSPTNEESHVDVVATGLPKVGESTDLVATVTPAGAGGTVVFRVNNSVVGQAPVQANGTAITDWVPQSAGQHTVDADFSGRPGVNPSTGGASVTVAEADPGAESTTTTLDSIATTPAGEEITLRAQVVPSGATGTVSFYNGQTLIGTADVNDGVATVHWTPDESGSYTIRARFNSEENFLSSQGTRQVIITPAIVEPEPDPDPTDPTDPDTGSLGSLTGSGDAGSASGSLGSLSNFGS